MNKGKYHVFVSYTERDYIHDCADWNYLGEFNTKEEAEKEMEETHLESFCRHIVIKGHDLNVDEGTPIHKFIIDE